MLDTSKLPDETKYAIARAAGLMDMYKAVGVDELAEIAQMTPEEAFKHWCNWKGFGGWGEAFINTLDTLRAAAK